MMKNKMIKLFLVGAVIMLVMAARVSAQSDSSLQKGLPGEIGSINHQSAISLAMIVSERISYQGLLEENGNLVTGDRDMIFRLYSDDSCTTQVGTDIDINNVSVENGLFSVQLRVDSNDFNGQGFLLEVEVGGTKITCQEILPVPYALSLRPGAIVATESTEDEAAALTGEVSSATPGVLSAGLRGINNGIGGNGVGVYGSHGGDGLGVLGTALGNGKGVSGSSTGADGYGVFGSHRSTTGDNPGVYGETISLDDNANGVEGVVTSSTPGGYSAGVRGINNGTGGSGIGVYGSQAGWGWGVYGMVDGDGKGVKGEADGANGIGVYGLANGTNGVGVYGQGSGSSSFALMLSSGGIGVHGAGLNTSTPVFIHQATASNILCTFSECTLIDHPLTNGDPNAILIVSHNLTPGGGTGTNDSHPVGVQYLPTLSKWAIYHIDLGPMFDGIAFNVMVVKP